jgi:hypothetical protein
MAPHGQTQLTGLVLGGLTRFLLRCTLRDYLGLRHGLWNFWSWFLLLQIGVRHSFKPSIYFGPHLFEIGFPFGPHFFAMGFPFGPHFFEKGFHYGLLHFSPIVPSNPNIPLLTPRCHALSVTVDGVLD